jgi:hypothetical protein
MLDIGRNRASLMSVLAAALAACGGRGDHPVTPDSLSAQGAAQVSSPTSGGRDACGLISMTEAESIVGNPLQVRPGEASSRSSSCDYMPRDGSGAGFSLKVYWTEGKKELATTKKAMGFAPKMMKQQEHMETGGMMALEPIDSLGEEAYYNAIVGSYVLKSDRLLEFDLRLLAFGHSDDGPRAKWLALARKAVDRL